jgi:hypothetical protein
MPPRGVARNKRGSRDAYALSLPVLLSRQSHLSRSIILVGLRDWFESNIGLNLCLKTQESSV